jgi:hypothetical protein
LSVGLLFVSGVAEKFFVFLGWWLFVFWVLFLLGFFLGCVWCGFWVFYHTLMGDLMVV